MKLTSQSALQFVVSALVSAGVALLALFLFLPTPTSDAPVSLPPVVIEREAQTSFDALLGDTRSKVLPALLPLYKQQASGLYEREKTVGTAVGLTGDGWVVAASPFTGTVALLPNGAAASPVQVVHDEQTGLWYGKFADAKFSVVNFGESAFLESGEATFLASALGLTHGSFLRQGFSGDGAVASGAALRRRLVVSQSGVPGDVVVLKNGLVVGILIDPAKHFAIPSELIRPFLDRLLRTGNGGHTSIASIEIVELGPVRSVSATTERLSGGALVKTVKRASSAEKSGFAVGDLLIAVEGEKLQLERPLAELLDQFQPGISVTVTVRRAGKEIPLSVQLSQTSERRLSP